MLPRVLVVLGVVALGAAAYLVMAGTEQTGTDTRTKDTGDEASAESRVILRGRGETPSPPASWLEVLVAQTATGSDENRHAAVREIQRRYAAGEIPLEALLPWALSSAGQGGSDELARWARATLAEERPASLALLPEILRAGLDATDARQGAVAQTLRALEHVRAEDLSLVAALFDHEQTRYTLKRMLVQVLEDLGEAVLPLAPALVDFTDQVLIDRARSMRDAMGAGIHVSWDHVEYDVQRLLAAMGDDVAPVLVNRLERIAHRLRTEGADDELFMYDPLGFLAGALVDTGVEGRRALARLLADDDPEVRREAAWALAHFDGALDSALFLAPLEAALQDSDARIRTSAAEALARCGPGAVSLLLGAVGDHHADVQEAAAQALARLEVGAEQALPPLVAVLGGEDEFAALAAARSIATYDTEAVSALDALLAHLATDDLWFRARFAVPIATVAAHEPTALVAAWEHGDAALRLGLLHVIGKAETLPEAWRALLERAVEDPALPVRVAAAAQLAVRGRRDVAQPLLAGFRSADGWTRTTATYGLARLGAAAAHLLPEVLERLMNDDDLWRPESSVHREWSEESALDAAVRAFGPHDLPRMFELIGHEEFNISYAATTAFQAAGAEGIAYFHGAWDTATSALRSEMLDIARLVFFREEHSDLRQAVRHLAERGLHDPSPQVRLQAVQTLDRDPGSRDRCLDALAPLLEDDDIQVVRMAAYRISTRGQHAARVEDALRAHSEHADEETRGYVRTALEHIEDAR